MVTSTEAAVSLDDSWRNDPWLGVNPIDPEFRAYPYPFLKRLRDYDPVNETPIGVFRLTRYDDVIRMLKEVPTGVRMADGTVFGGAGVRVSGGPSEFILQQDPPDHTRLRKLVNQAFTPRAIERLRSRVRTLVAELLD